MTTLLFQLSRSPPSHFLFARFYPIFYERAVRAHMANDSNLMAFIDVIAFIRLFFGLARAAMHKKNRAQHERALVL